MNFSRWKDNSLHLTLFYSSNFDTYFLLAFITIILGIGWHFYYNFPATVHCSSMVMLFRYDISSANILKYTKNFNFTIRQSQKTFYTLLNIGDTVWLSSLFIVVESKGVACGTWRDYTELILWLDLFQRGVLMIWRSDMHLINESTRKEISKIRRGMDDCWIEAYDADR